MRAPATPRRHPRQRCRILLLEALEDRLIPSASPLAPWSHEEWAQQRFSLGAEVRVDSEPGGPAVSTSLEHTLIRADQARSRYPFRGTGYSVAVIDTGIDYRHPALGGGWGTRVIAGWDFVNNDSDPMDDQGHGTHVAGIIGSSDATYSGIAPEVNLIALKVLDSSGSGSFGDVEEALQWVAAHQAQFNIVAVNLSLGTGNFATNPFTFLEDEFSALTNQGVFVAVASGNSFYSVGSQPGLGYPAISPQVVSVGAVWSANFGSASWSSGGRDYSTAADRITSFTQRSASLDLLAPGAYLTNTYRGGGFATMAGTSMAAPVVAGAAALIHQALDASGKSYLANQSYILSLMQTTGAWVVDGDDENDNVVNTGLAFRRLDVLSALQAIVPQQSPTSPPFAPPGNNPGGTRPPSPSASLPSIGIFDPNTATWHVRGPSPARFAYGAPGWVSVVGDWNGDGVATVGVFDPGTATFYLRNSNTPGAADAGVFQFGASDWIPLAGDWDGDGRASIGVFDPSTATFYLRNSNTAGAPDAGRFRYGASEWMPVVGDWNGDGRSTIGVFDPAAAIWYLRNRNSGGAPDLAPFTYGAPGWTPVAGDWNGDQRTGIGVFDPASARWYLKNALSAGAPDIDPFAYGADSWRPFAGNGLSARAAFTAEATGEVPSQLTCPVPLAGEEAPLGVSMASATSSATLEWFQHSVESHYETGETERAAGDSENPEHGLLEAVFSTDLDLWVAEW